AILMTISVLELKVAQGTDWDALRPLVPVLRVGGATRHFQRPPTCVQYYWTYRGTACQVTSSSTVGSGADVTASPTWTAGPASPIRPAYSRAIRRRPSGPWPRSRAARPRGRRGPPFGWPTRSSATRCRPAAWRAAAP